MKTFTNCAKKKAKQFLNVLQGYTKGIRITAILILLLMGVSNAWGATQRYIYVGISKNYYDYKDGNNYGFNFWGGTSGGVKSGTYLTTYTWDGRKYYMYRVQVYDDNNKAQFKGNNNWWDPGDGFSVTLNGTTNNAVFFSHSKDGWQGQFQENYQETSTASLTASSTSVTTGTNVTLTPSLSSNATYNQIKSTTYTVSTNPNSGGSVTSDGVFSATKAGTYTVKATVTYNPKYFTGITKTATATVTITVTVPTHTVSYGICSTTRWGSIKLNSETAITTTGTKTLNYGTSISFTATPNVGYQVEGWYSNSGCTSKITAAGTSTTYDAGTLTADKTVYVKFEAIPANSHNITYTPQGTGWTYGTKPTSAEEGEEVAFIVKPDEGYDVDVSSSDVALEPNDTEYSFIMPNYDVTIEVSATAKTYTIEFDKEGGEGGTDEVTVQYKNNNYSLNPIIAPERAGYTFSGYYVAKDGGGFQVVAANGTWMKSAYGYTDANGNWSKANDVVLHAYWIKQKEIYLVGEFNWDAASENIFTQDPNDPNIYKLTKRFEKRDRYDMTDPNGPGQPEYEFKLQVDGTKYTVETKDGKKILQYTRQSKTKVLSDGNNYNSDPYYNLLLQADISGNYVFEYNVESKELTVEHPAYQSEASYIVGDFSDGQTGTDALPKDGGAGYDWTEEHGKKFENNTVTICFDGTGKKWEFKIKINGIWYGAEGLVIDKDGTYTLSNTYAFQSETNCAIQTSGVNGCYTFTYTDNGNGTINLTVGFPKQSENPTTVYLKPNDDWKKDNARFALYYWNNNGNSWKDMSPVDCNGDYYSVEVPKGYSNFIFCRMNGNTSGNDWNNKWNQTNDLTLPNDAKILYDIESTKYLYFTPYNNEWKQGNERYAAYFFETDKNDVWVSMTDSDGDGTYECEKPEGYTNVIFCRMNGNTSDNGWNNKWDQSADQKIPNDKNHCNETGYWSLRGDHCGWTTYTEPTYDVKINITGKGAIVIDGQTYEGTSEGTTTITIEDLRVNTNINVTSIEPAERWAYKDDNATIKIGTGDNESLVANSTHLICAPTTITAEFTQTLCEVIFELNLDEGVEYPEPVNPQYITPGDTVVKPHIVHINGYMFDGWYKEPTCKNKYTFSTPVNKDMTLYAKWAPYSECIFFKNNLNWDSIYIYTFKGNVWGDDGQGVYPANRYEYGKMKQIGYSDVYYYVLTKADGFNYIAFSDYNMSTYDKFYEHNAIYRGDRQDHMSLFIPQREQTPDYRNKTAYYNSGLWMKYNSTESGYKWSSDKNDWNTDINPFTAPLPGGYSFSVKVALNGGTTYLFKVNNINRDWYGEKDTMTKEHCTDLWLPYNMETEYNTTIQPNVTGEYIFTIYLGDGKVMISLEYPLDVNDYRLAYNDTTTGFHPGHYIRRRFEENRLDTVSFFVHKDYSPQVLLQKCISINVEEGTAEWATIGEPHPVNVASTSVYNFVLQQTGTTEAEHKAEVQMDKTHLYTGNFYIRTDKAPGGWDYFRQEDNMIHFSSYASDHENFTHYFCKWVKSNDKEGYSNVAFTIANDYSYCISDTMDNDEIIKQGQTAQGYLPEDANVRFSWNNKDNSINRAYIAGSSWVRDRFLVLQGNNQLFDVEGNELPEGVENTNRDGLHENEVIFTDKGNWIYQVDVQANKDTEVKLTALYNNVVQYFKGNEKETTTLLESTAAKNYKIRLIYDFKINKLVSAWLAGGDTIDNEDKELGADMMIIRHNQDPAEQLNFDPTTRQLSGIGTAYAVMTFDKYFLNNRAEDGSHLSDADKQSPYARALYWISFPFDVKLSEVFGFGEYGDYWIMEYYDGAARAKNGLWADTDTYWKYISNKDYVLKAGQGYVISLNLNKMGFESNIFDNTAEISLYFPSDGALNTITGVPLNYEAPEHQCTIEREDGIHKIYDSHWNVIGVPGFADIENVNVEGHLFKQDSIHFYYEYLPQTNEYRTRRAGNSPKTANFQTMYSYMVQYYGGINWSAKTFTRPSAIAARRTGDMPSQYDLRLELAIDDQLHDQTFLLLDEDKRATAEYDVNLDLTKIMNKNASIYTLAGEQRITLSGNTLPMGKATVPVGVRVAIAGEYTFRMPDGTDGISAVLVDNETGKHTNMLLDDYTITLDAGTCENRFFLVLDPQRTSTEVENIGNGAHGDEVNGNGAKGIKKYIIDGHLVIRTADAVYDAQGQRL